MLPRLILPLFMRNHHCVQHLKIDFRNNQMMCEIIKESFSSDALLFFMSGFGQLGYPKFQGMPSIQQPQFHKVLSTLHDSLALYMHFVSHDVSIILGNLSLTSQALCISFQTPNLTCLPLV